MLVTRERLARPSQSAFARGAGGCWRLGGCRNCPIPDARRILPMGPFPFHPAACRLDLAADIYLADAADVRWAGIAVAGNVGLSRANAKHLETNI